MKTASTSVEVLLSGMVEEQAVVTEIFPAHPHHRPRNQGPFYNHISAGQVKEVLTASVWSSLFTFCVERDPWEKVVSYYFMQKARGFPGTMDDFLKSGSLPLNFPLYTDPSEPSRIIVSRVLRYERLDDELTDVFRVLEIPFAGKLAFFAKASYRTDRRSARQILSPAQAQWIAVKFAHEISMHGYTWES